MRKVKFYFGKRRLKHTWGIDFECRYGKWWVVPHILRNYFMREYQAYCERMNIKILGNGQVGVNSFSIGRHWSSSADGGPIVHERSTSTTYYSVPQVGPVDKKGSPLPLTEQCMTPQGKAFLERIQSAPAEVDPNPPVVPFVRYSDYDLPRSPETEAVYQATLNKLSPDSSE